MKTSRPPCPPPARPRRSDPPRGFAILITIAMLAFLVLLMLAMTLLTRVSTQMSANGLQDAAARQNALAALNLAIGQLDKFAGPDQRVTTTADFGRINDGDPVTAIPTGFATPNTSIGLVAPNASGGTRQWTGVYGWSSTTTIGAQAYTTTPSPVLLNWLVSGNEGTALTVGTGGVVSSTAAKPAFQPNQAVTGLSATVSALTANLTIGSASGGSKPAMLLVGPNTVGNGAVTTTLSAVTVQTSAVARYVVAPLLDLTVAGAQVPGLGGTASYRVGRIAYVVLDEGVKAKYNLRDTNSTSSALTTTVIPQTRQRFLAAPRNGIERMQGFAGYPINTLSASNTLAPSQVRFADSNLSATTTASQTTWQGHFHDFTTYSYGVLADSMRGGLRYDLTAAFDQATLTTTNPLYSTVTATAGLKGKFILPDGTGTPAAGSVTTTEAGGPAVSPVKGPKWDTLKSYYDLSALTATTSGTVTLSGVAQANNGAVFMRGPVDVSGNPQEPIAPVVVQARLRFGLFMAAGASEGTPPYPFYISCAPVFVLANPYNFPITVPTAGLDLQYVMNTLPPDSSGLSGPTAGSRTSFDWGIDANIRWGNGLGLLTGKPGINANDATYPNGHFDSPFDMELYPGLRDKPVTSDGTTLRQYGTLDEKHHLSGYFPLLKNNAVFGYDTDPSVLGSVAFHITQGAATTFAPGEVKIFSLSYVAVDGPAPNPAPIANEAYPQGGFSANALTPDLCAAIVTGPDTPGNTAPARILNLDPVFNPAYFLRDTSQPNVPAPNGGWPGQCAVYPDGNAMLMVVYPAPACSLELRVGGSLPGQNVVKSVLNMDLTGYPRGTSNLPTTVGTTAETVGGASFPTGSPLVEAVPNDGYRRNKATTWPMTVTEYYFSLAPPETVWLAHHRANGPTPYELDFFNADNLSNRVSYRSYADYNLRASNLALSPVAPLGVPIPKVGVLTFQYNDDAYPVVYVNKPGFPTVPPYDSMFDQVAGPDSSPPPVTATSAQFSDLNTMSYWGHSTGGTMVSGANAVKNVILYNSPSRTPGTSEMPVFSLGQFQHADATADDLFASVGYQPGNAIGNSWYSPYVARTTSFRKGVTVKSDPRPMTGSTANPSLATGVGVYDISYLLNAALWDRYFFSTLRQTGSVAGKPANPRLSFAAGYTPTIAQLGINASAAKPATVPEPTDPNNATKNLPTPYAAARFLLVNGAFNINSTSVEAWRAVLSSLRAIGLNNAVSTSTTVPNGETPYPRSLPPPSFVGNSSFSSMLLSSTVFAATGTGIESPSFVGFRKLTDPQIDALAVRIVQEIRSRGPFLSLAQFVNRKLGAATDPASSVGILQSALNTAANTPAILTNAQELVKFSPNDTTIYPDFDITKESANRSEGIPGWLTQADLLQALGPVIAARSDTFVVRAYGEVVDPFDANATSTTQGPAAASIQARAWCEAVVQRMPDYSDSTNSPALAPTDPSFTAPNKQFGRKFQIVSFRWLTSNDI